MYKRRIKIFLGLIGCVFAVFVLRLGQLQLVQGDYWTAQAEELLETTTLLPAGRGRILDRTGRYVLAQDRPCYDFCLDYRLFTDIARISERWARHQQRLIRRQDPGLTAEQAKAVFRRRLVNTCRIAEQAAAHYQADLNATIARLCERIRRIREVVGTDIREQRMAHPMIRGLSGTFPLEETVGAYILPSHRRHYPYGELACHVIGLVGPVTSERDQLNLRPEEADWLTRQRENYRIDDLIGKTGVENLCEKVLRGRRGYQKLKRAEHGYEPIEWARAEHGGDVHLTIDFSLQGRLTELLRGTGSNGSIVVLSVPRGEVLSMVSLPTFDLNRYRTDRGYFRAIGQDNVNSPLLHRAVAAAYPPGSTAKPVAAFSALATGAITPETVFRCEGKLFPDQPGFGCLRAHGDVQLIYGIRKSCNVYFYNVGRQMGWRRMVDWFQRFGFGQAPGLGLPGERAGTLPTPDCTMARYGRRPQTSDAMFMAIGQGAITASPLQVANAMATIARRGEYASPMLVLEGGAERVRWTLPVSDAHVDAIHRGMYEVVNDPGGTAYRYFHAAGTDDLGVEVCGKTGTAQVPPLARDVNGDGRITAEEILRTGNMAWFAGFAPYRRPRIAFAVVREYAGHGGQDCAPLGREIVRLCKELGHLE